MRERAGLTGIRRLAALVLAGLVLALFAPAASASPHPYVTVYGSPSDPVVLRLVPELLSLGCAVRTDASPMPDPAASKEGDAVVRVTETTVTFWLLDPRTGHATEEGNVRIDDRGAEGVKLTSVRVSEIVRAELLRFEPAKAQEDTKRVEAPVADAGVTDAASSDLGAPPTEHSSPAPPPSSVLDTRVPDASVLSPGASVSATASGPPHVSASLGTLVVLPTGGAKPGLDLALVPAWHVSSNLDLRLLLAVPLTSPSVTGTGGEAAIAAWVGGVTVDRTFRSSDDAWRGAFGAGAAVAFAQVRGSPSAGYVGSSTSAVVALPFVELGGSRALGTARVRLGVSGLLGVALPPVVVQFAGQDVATWGPVVGGASGWLDVDMW